MEFLKKSVIFIVLLALALGFLIGRGTAHVGTKPTLTCSQVSADFTSFPSGTHDVTFVVTVNGTTSNVSSSFTGTSGTASADISSLTTATGELSLSAHAEWSDDGGGQTEPVETKLTCHETPPKPPETPPVTTPTPPEAPTTQVETQAATQENFVGK